MAEGDHELILLPLLLSPGIREAGPLPVYVVLGIKSRTSLMLDHQHSATFLAQSSAYFYKNKAFTFTEKLSIKHRDFPDALDTPTLPA